jgi:hemolysin activation/secretion protein
MGMTARDDAPEWRLRLGVAVTPAGLLSLLTAFGSAAAEPPGAPAAAQPAGQAVSAKFDVLELRVQGNTVLDARSIESAVYPFTGPAKQMTDVEAARAALERAYHDRGYGTVFVDIPEQSVDDGVVRLRVTEGRLRQVRVVGAHYFSGREIRAAIPAAQENSVPNLPEVQRELTALNAQTPDRTVLPVLKAGPEPGTVDMSLKVQEHVPFHGSVELNNQYTADTTHLRALVAASYDNMFGRLDTFSFQYQVAPEAAGETHVIAGNYALHLAPDGSNLSFQYINSHSDVATIGTLGVFGTGSVYTLRYLKPLPATGSSQSLAVELDYKSFGQSILVSSAASGLNTPVDYINMSTAYSFARGIPHALFDWSTTADFGVRGAPNNAEQFANKRFDASPNYFYLRSDGGVTVQLPASLTAAFRLTGQYSEDPLINNEQISLGGVASVRGYLEAEYLADSAVRGSFQLGAPPLSLVSGQLHFNEFLFYDAARAFLNDPLAGQARQSDLRSWGVGLKFDAYNHLSGTLTWADPLVTGTRTLRGDSTLLFYLRGTW